MRSNQSMGPSVDAEAGSREIQLRAQAYDLMKHQQELETLLAEVRGTKPPEMLLDQIGGILACMKAELQRVSITAHLPTQVPGHRGYEMGTKQLPLSGNSKTVLCLQLVSKKGSRQVFEDLLMIRFIMTGGPARSAFSVTPGCWCASECGRGCHDKQCLRLQFQLQRQLMTGTASGGCTDGRLARGAYVTPFIPGLP